MSLSADVKASCFVFELGTEKGEPHMHFYFETGKSRNTIVKALKQWFYLPSDRGQRYSLKFADPAKLDKYFVYLAKGITGKKEDKVFVVFEENPRLWPEMHVKYHEVAEQIKSPKAKEDWYLTLANELRASGSTSKEDVMQAVTRFYVYESKKGFDRFLVVRTFWRVFSLVNASDAHQCMLEQCMDSIRG